MIQILLIEDDFMIAHSTAQLLQMENMVVNITNNGMDGLQYLIHHDVDLVLLDLGLPGMNGFEVLHKIRQKSTVPVIVISARDQVQDRLDVLKRGGVTISSNLLKWKNWWHVSTPFYVGHNRKKAKAIFCNINN